MIEDAVIAAIHDQVTAGLDIIPMVSKHVLILICRSMVISKASRTTKRKHEKVWPACMINAEK